MMQCNSFQNMHQDILAESPCKVTQTTMNVFIIILLLFFSVFVVYFIVIPLLLGYKIHRSIALPSYFYFFPMFGYMAQFKKSKDITGDAFALPLKNKPPNAQLLVTNLLNRPYVILQTPALAKEYLLNHDKFYKFGTKMALFSSLYFQKSIASVDGQVWRHQKKIVSWAMNYKFFKEVVPQVQKIARRVLRQNQKEGTMKVYDKTLEIAAETISTSFFSKNMNEVKIRDMGLISKLRELIKFCSDQTASMGFLLRNMVLRKDSVEWGVFLTKKQKSVLQDFRVIYTIIEQEIQKRVHRLQSSTQEPVLQDLLDYYVHKYLEPENKRTQLIDKTEIVQQFITFFTAGSDTTSALAGMCFRMLAEHPQQALRLRQIVERLPDDLSMDEVEKHPQFTHFIKETARIYPPTFDLFPRFNKQPVKIGDYSFPANTFFGLGIKFIMNDPANFPEPEKFRPERWAESASSTSVSGGSNIDPWGYLTFSLGPRSCIGERLAMLEIKIMMIELLRNWGSVQINPAIQRKMVVENLYKMENDEVIIVGNRAQP